MINVLDSLADIPGSNLPNRFSLCSSLAGERQQYGVFNERTLAGNRHCTENICERQ